MPRRRKITAEQRELEDQVQELRDDVSDPEAAAAERLKLKQLEQEKAGLQERQADAEETAQLAADVHEKIQERREEREREELVSKLAARAEGLSESAVQGEDVEEVGGEEAQVKPRRTRLAVAALRGPFDKLIELARRTDDTTDWEVRVDRLTPHKFNGKTVAGDNLFTVIPPIVRSELDRMVRERLGGGIFRINLGPRTGRVYATDTLHIEGDPVDLDTPAKLPELQAAAVAAGVADIDPDYARMKDELQRTIRSLGRQVELQNLLRTVQTAAKNADEGEKKGSGNEAVAEVAKQIEQLRQDFQAKLQEVTANKQFELLGTMMSAMFGKSSEMVAGMQQSLQQVFTNLLAAKKEGGAAKALDLNEQLQLIDAMAKLFQHRDQGGKVDVQVMAAQLAHEMIAFFREGQELQGGGREGLVEQVLRGISPALGSLLARQAPAQLQPATAPAQLPFDVDKARQHIHEVARAQVQRERRQRRERAPASPQPVSPVASQPAQPGEVEQDTQVLKQAVDMLIRDTATLPAQPEWIKHIYNEGSINLVNGLVQVDPRMVLRVLQPVVGTEKVRHIAEICKGNKQVGPWIRAALMQLREWYAQDSAQSEPEAPTVSEQPATAPTPAAEPPQETPPNAAEPQ